MDTRSKILTAGEPWPDFERPLAVAIGYFDVLRVGHARELRQAREAAGTLVAVVLPRAGELLTIRARAELAAGLQAVDYVAFSADGLQADSLVRLEDPEEVWVRELRERVLSAGGPSGSGASK